MADILAQAGPRVVPDRLLDAAGISLDRLPMLRVAFDRMATYCSDSLRHLCASPAYFHVKEIATGQIGQMLDGYAGQVVAAVFHAPGWDSRVLVGLDRRLIYSLAETLFGGDGSEAPAEEERPFTNIETRIAQAIFDQASSALEAAFASIAETAFQFERIETRMDYAAIARRSSLAAVAKLHLRALERGGEMFVIVPQAALNPIRHNLARDIADDVSARDPRWTKQIENEIRRTEVTLRAVIEERQFTLGDIAALRVGQVLKLEATPKSSLKLECNDQALFWCRLGQSEGAYTVRIEDHVDQEQEFLDDILAR